MAGKRQSPGSKRMPSSGTPSTAGASITCACCLRTLGPGRWWLFQGCPRSGTCYSVMSLGTTLGVPGGSADRLVVTFENRWMVLLGVLLHLADFDSFQIEDLRRSGKKGTPTAGQIEDSVRAAGIQIASGPLPHGLADAVRLAFEEAGLAERFNKTDAFVVDHRTYYWVIGGSCTTENIVIDAASFAGHLKLHKLTVIYCNDEQDMSSQFKVLGWHTFTIENVHEDMTQFKDAILCAQTQTIKPTFIQIKTFKWNLHGRSAIRDFRKKICWEDREQFYVIPMVYREFNHQAELGRCLESEWNTNLQHYCKKCPHVAEELRFLIKHTLWLGRSSRGAMSALMTP